MKYLLTLFIAASCLAQSGLRSPTFVAQLQQPASGFTYYATHFDGSNDYMTDDSGDQGATDSDRGLISYWVKFAAASDGQFVIIMCLNRSGSPNGVSFSKFSDDKIRFYCANSGSGVVLDMQTTSAFTSASGWLHVVASWDLSTAGRRKIYVNGVDETTETTFSVGGTIDYAGANPTKFGADHDNALKLAGDISEFYFTIPASYYDLSSSSNRDKFYNSGTGKPVDLGSDGSTPTGTQPLTYLKNPFGTFQNNAGSGGNWTVTGTLTAASTIP